MRTRLLLALGLAIIASVTAAATARSATKPAKPLTVSALAHRLKVAFAYVDPKLTKKLTLADVQAVVASSHPDYRLVVISTLPSGVVSAEATAQQLLPKLATATPKVTFVAVEYAGPNGIDIGGAGGPNQLLIREAAKTALSEGKGDLLATMQIFTTTFTTAKTPTKAKSSGTSILSILLYVLVAAAIAGGGLLLLRTRKVSRERRGRARVGSIGTARTFHLERLDRLSLRHSELVRTVGERPDDPSLAVHHETAGAKLVAIRRQMAGLFSPRELRTCAVELDQAEWHVECAEALIGDLPLPPQPSDERSGLCFFTHEHGLGSVEVDLVKPDGSIATVWVCPPNAVALSRAEALLVSSVHVGSRLVPWPAVPTYYGAPGWSTEDLPGLEYQGREIWGRTIPQRDQPVDVPPESLPGLERDQVLPPGVSTPLPPGVSAPAGSRRRPAPLDDPHDDDGLPPGVTLPAALLDADLPIPGTSPLPAPADEGRAAATQFEELEGTPTKPTPENHNAPVEIEPPRSFGPDEFDVTDEHPALRLDDTQGYDPFADDDAPAWERTAADEHDAGQADQG